MGCVCPWVLEQTPKKPKAVVRQCQVSTMPRGTVLEHSPGVRIARLGLRQQWTSPVLQSPQELTLLMLNNIFFPLGLIQCLPAQRLQCRCITLSALPWPRTTPHSEDSSSPWELTFPRFPSEEVSAYFFVVTLRVATLPHQLEFQCCEWQDRFLTTGGWIPPMLRIKPYSRWSVCSRWRIRKHFQGLNLIKAKESTIHLFSFRLKYYHLPRAFLLKTRRVHLAFWLKALLAA